ncbi:MAG TPA: hypothetical protein PJ997_01755 [Candidatus Paceibacterota bacterium]|nr:hypothetical protein [Candidatus Paceibacterota bacterium]HMP19043.1 hypothetical protein [Candidatus Paceibacterota bacterium]HMP85192.1 hypothetical protein [Candidatus Paceibacterota bacterium]
MIDNKNKIFFNASKKRGVILSTTLVFAIITISLIVALTSWFAIVFKTSLILIAKEQAFHIAESGIEYYRWHLAHAPNDFTNGTDQPGPYIHDVFDKDGNVIGQFSLNIIPPQNGTTIVTIESTGFVSTNSDVSRKIRVQLAKPSFAKYAFVSDSDMRFGEGTEVFGPIHSNGGIRFDGLSHNVVTSSRADYDDPDHTGPNEFGVHTHLSPIDPLPPANVPDRFDVFRAGRQFPVPAVDFSGMISNLADLKNLSQNGGLYFAESGGLGYRMVLKTDDTLDLYRVTSLMPVPHSTCTNNQNQEGWGTWSIQNSVFIGSYNFPSNGIIFVEDHLWISGQINGARLNIAAGRFPDVSSNWRNIIINENLLYTNYDGSDVIGLIAQNNINIGLFSATNLRIDSALIAQNGRIGRHYYRGPYSFNSACSPHHQKNTITLYGMIATKNRYGFAYADGTGYSIRNINYDANLLYGPPPQFPLTSDNYQTISWEEVK